MEAFKKVHSLTVNRWAEEVNIVEYYFLVSALIVIHAAMKTKLVFK